MSLRVLLAISVAVVIVACSGSSDDHGHDAADAGADGSDAADAVADAAADVPTKPDGAATCNPVCNSLQVCCVDVHGHFPTCRAGPVCP